MYHRFTKSLKPSNRTIRAMASNPAGLGIGRWNDSIFTNCRLSGKCLKSLNSQGALKGSKPTFDRSLRHRRENGNSADRGGL
jgi:hypothetical protein